MKLTAHKDMPAASIYISEAYFREANFVLPIGIFHTNAQGFVVYVNEQFCEIYDVTPEQAIGTGWTNLMDPDDRERSAAKWNAFVNKGPSTLTDECRCQRPGGGVAYYCIQLVPVVDADGSPTGYVGCVTDVTAHKQTEQKLRERDSQLSDFAEVALDWWFWEQDADLKFTSASPEVFEKSGIATIDYIGKTRREIVTLAKDCGVKSLLILFKSPAIFRSHSISSRSRPIVLEIVQ